MTSQVNKAKKNQTMRFTHPEMFRAHIAKKCGRGLERLRVWVRSDYEKRFPEE